MKNTTGMYPELIKINKRSDTVDIRIDIADILLLSGRVEKDHKSSGWNELMVESLMSIYYAARGRE